MHLSPHFTLRELCHSEVAKKNNIYNAPSSERELFNLCRLCSLVLEPLRKATGNRPLRINSCYRSRELNKLVKGAENSYHMRGLAVDIPISQFTVNNFNILDKYISDRKGTLIKEYIKYPTFVHIAISSFY